VAEAVFKPQGPLAPLDNDLFVGRLYELTTIENAVRAPANDAYLAILGPRQIGKTSLLHRVQATITDSWRIVVIDFQNIPGVSQAECYAYIYDNIRDQIKGTLGFRAKLRRRPQVDTPPKFCISLQRLALDSRATKIVVLLDEVVAVGDDTAVALCRTIRYIFSNRQRRGHEGFSKYLFIFAGAWDLYQLSRGDSQVVSPLSNVVGFIYLADLGPEESIVFLNRNLGRVGKPLDPGVVNYIYQITEGHPYLLQRIGSLLERVSRERKGTAITPSMVDGVIDEILAHDQHLVNLVELLLEDDNLNELIEFYRIIQGKEVSFSRTVPQVARLELMGLIKSNEQGLCACKNQIYQRMILENKAIGRLLFADKDHHISTKLIELLPQLDRRFLQMRESAWEMLQTKNPERGRMAAHECRELLNQLLHHLAPDDKVLALPEYGGLKRKDISRKVRVRYILGGPQQNETQVRIANSLANLSDDMYGALSGRAHRDDDVDIAEVKSFMRTTEEVIVMILEGRVR
jgi:hypothetical protein